MNITIGSQGPAGFQQLRDQIAAAEAENATHAVRAAASVTISATTAAIIEALERGESRTSAKRDCPLAGEGIAHEHSMECKKNGVERRRRCPTRE